MLVNDEKPRGKTLENCVEHVNLRIAVLNERLNLRGRKFVDFLRNTAGEFGHALAPDSAQLRFRLDKSRESRSIAAAGETLYTVTEL